MGKHDEWRKIAKKARRKRIRQAKAIERDKKLLEEQEKLQNSPRYQRWLEQQERMQEEYEQEELHQGALREEQWRKVEAEAQKQWQELQIKIASAREEKMKQNMKIKLEWEKEQQRLKELKEIKEKELEEKRLIQEKHEKELLDFLEQGGETPEHLKITMETNPGKQTCPFFHKVSACRFFDSCSRNHVRPGISKTLLISNFFSDISLETKENEHGSDCTLEFEKEDTYEHYKEFFYDVILELEKCGRIRNFRTCCNHESHLRGNVYVEYHNTRDALVAYHRFNGRWYGGKQLNVEFCGIKSWRIAICGLFSRKRCPKGNACNFLHVFKNPRNLHQNLEEESVRSSSRSSREVSRRSCHRKKHVDDCWDTLSPERNNWRWSESPERIHRKESDKTDTAERQKDNGRHPLKKVRPEKDSRRHSDDKDQNSSRRRRRYRSRPRSLSSSRKKSRSSRSNRNTPPGKTRKSRSKSPRHRRTSTKISHDRSPSRSSRKESESSSDSSDSSA